MSDTSHEDAIKAYDEYLNHRNALQAASLEIAGRFSQWMLTLSGGALGLSITFIEKLKPLISDSSRMWLIFSWIAFSTSLLTCLFSLYSSYTATQSAIVSHDRVYLAKRNNPDDLIAEPVNRAGNLTDSLSYASMALFALGILALCVFASSANFQPTKQDGQTNQTTTKASNNPRNIHTCPDSSSTACSTSDLRPTKAASTSAEKEHLKATEPKQKILAN